MILGVSASGRRATRDEEGRLLCGAIEELIGYARGWLPRRDKGLPLALVEPEEYGQAYTMAHRIGVIAWV
jgi:hypothetical protein